MVEVRSLTLRASSWPLPEGQVGGLLVDLSKARDRWVLI